MISNHQQSKSITQQRAAKKDRNALNRAAKKNISDKEIINHLAENHTKPNSAEAMIEAAGAVIHTRCNMAKESPIHDAVEAIEAQRACYKNLTPSPALT